jgi:hypothetical protein
MYLPLYSSVVFFCFLYLVYADDVNILGRSVHTIKKNTETLVVASKETGLEANVGKTKYMVISRDQNAERDCITNIDNSSFERVEEFICLGKTFTYKNSIQENIRSSV